ncbi:MAG: DUF3800 domain-containing protein [Zetaproteobacteria bacterium]|nr:DUF3800 domain-containing protein [Zetaproteobacteria bacterium]
MKDIRKHPFRQPTKIIPTRLVGKTTICPKCKAIFRIPWVENQIFPKQPILPYSGGGQWIPVSINIKCNTPECRETIDIQTPIVEVKSKWNLFGDEAGRLISEPLPNLSTKSLHFFCITLIGLHSTRQKRVERRLRSLKKSICPQKDPSTWVHHFSDIWGSDPKEKQYDLATKRAKIKYAKSFARILRSERPNLASFNISSCIEIASDKRERRVSLKYQKEDVFSQSILLTLDKLRESQLSVSWTFDNIKDSTNGNRTEGWASECFLGLQYLPLFTWLSAGAYIEQPRFVKPGSNFLLEIADFMSFWVAREFERKSIGKDCELSTASFGKGYYQGTIQNGNVLTEWSDSLPLKKFYGFK